MSKLTREAMVNLVENVKAHICDEYRAFDEDETPGIQLTVGTNKKQDDWDYQTGDNSFSGGAYRFPFWAVIGVYEDTSPKEAAAEIFGQFNDLR